MSKFIWIDAATPKYALFFSYLMPHLHDAGLDTLVTTRYSENYTEAKSVLDMRGLDYHLTGNYGGETVAGKFRARTSRQLEFLELFDKTGMPDAVLCGSVVDSIQTGFGLGMEVINFCDTPIRGSEFRYEDITIVTKLTVMLSSLLFHPFVIPRDVFSRMGVDPARVITHDFIDVCLWMNSLEKNEENDFRRRYGLDISKPTIMIREEEFKAHYVHEKLSVLYELIPRIADEVDANIVILPRYEIEPLKERFGEYAVVLEEKLPIESFYPFIDFLVGGGGTMNLEAACYGIPVLSLRSLLLFHDVYLIENGMMSWTNDADEALDIVKRNLGVKRDNRDYFSRGECSAAKLAEKIGRYMEGGLQALS
ncbi:DUF354 domain-containing protein [Limisalsivibrio acetivorans]|uniref:DUF354 domain-containing protein n=1 Tax=Limisalsivibrio acetivorans TaxID=1304888 RepID=UPI0003B53120|nr:DUF354 domain-containing protein [Limisalsivibrio acetivorans]